MKFIPVSILLISVFFGTSLAQSKALDEEAKQFVIQVLENIQKRTDPCHYRVKMFFKESGGDTFEIKECIINYRTNGNNHLYGYDYEIAELRGPDTLISMAKDTSFYLIITRINKLTERALPDVVVHGSYFENIRSNYIINEVLLNFLNEDPNEILITDSSGNYYLQHKVNDFAVVHLSIDKQTLLPMQWSTIIKSAEFDLTQTLEVYFSFNEDFNTLPATAFSIERYLTAGYEHIVHESDTSTTSEKMSDDYTITLENQDLLLNYPFILPEGDTVVIKAKTSSYILLDFWYASCRPCLQALPELNNLAEQYAESGLVVLGINCFDKGIKENLALKMRDKGIHIPLLFGSKELINKLGITRFPSYYLITPEHKMELIVGGVEGVRDAIETIFK